MASPQNRSWRGSATSATPARSSLLSRAPSTPLDLYRASQATPQSSSPSSFAAASPVNGAGASRRATSLRPTSLSQSASPTVFLSSPDRDGPTSPYRRNAAFGSPGASASRNAARHSSPAAGVIGGPRSSLPVTTASQTPSKSQDQGSQGFTSRSSSRFIRRKTLRQRIEEMPEAIYDYLSMAPSMFLADPSLGYPAGAVLHVISIFAMVMHPDSALHAPGSGSRMGRRMGQVGGGALFANDRNANGVGLASRKIQRQQDAWRSTATLFAFALLALAVANAHSLFTAKRRYHLWLKPTSEKLASENASLVDLPGSGPTEEDLQSSNTFLERALRVGEKLLHAIFTVIGWLWALILWRLRQIPYLGVIFRILFAAPGSHSQSRRGSGSSGHPQMHALDVWQAPEVQLRIFCVYSPLHALFYLVLLKAGRAGLDGSASSLLLSLILMGAISAQAYLLATFYSGLVKDKTLLAAEVMNEYDQKFVLPRAMPEVRDASTQTNPSDYETVLQPRQPTIQEWRGTYQPQTEGPFSEGEEEQDDKLSMGSIASARSSSALHARGERGGQKRNRTRKSVF